MQTSYLDLYFLHWPNSKIPINKTLNAMETLRKESKIRHIGLSNVTINHLKKALEVGVPISWVQVEMHPFYYDPLFLQYCNDHQISVQAWRPLNLGKQLEDSLLSEIGKRHHKTSAQVSLRWILQHGCIPLPGSKNPSHIRENFEIYDFYLTAEEMRAIDLRAAQGHRLRIHKDYGLGFTDEFDYSYEECWPTLKE